MGSARSAFLYVIGAGRGAHKIGVSLRPKRRLAQLQTGNPSKLILRRATEAEVTDAEKVEDYAHWLLRESRVRGEWFRVTEEAAWVALTAAVDAVARGLSVPLPPKPVPKTRGRPKRDFEPMFIRFAIGTKDRIRAVLRDGEDHAHFMRSAIEAELKRRERTLKPPETP
jgi:predicted GIY-YIG superfamily endonuclease